MCSYVGFILPFVKLFNTDSECVTLDNGLNLSDHFGFLLKLEVDAQIMGFQKSHSQSDHTTDTSKTSNTRLRWDQANHSS